MKAAAILVGLLACACFVGAAWLWIATSHFFSSDAYAPKSSAMPGYRSGGVEADGGGIFAPALLLFALGLFLARFAFNLWKDRRGR